MNLHSPQSDYRGPFASTRHRLRELFDSGEPLERLLTEIVAAVEDQCSGMLCSILLVESDGKHFRVGAAPNLPSAYNALFQNVLIGEGVGSCGTSAYRNEVVIVSDIETDPLWANYKEYALPHALRACWSSPICSGRQVLGTFACYYREPKAPEADELGIIQMAANLASEAIRFFRSSVSNAGTNTKTVLLVDDHDEFREMVRELLTRDGYEVLEAASSEAALSIWGKESDRIDLVLTDHEMPGMTGMELALVVLQQRRPGTKVLVMSGTLDTTSDNEFLFLAKPFSRSDLQQKLREAFA